VPLLICSFISPRLGLSFARSTPFLAALSRQRKPPHPLKRTGGRWPAMQGRCMPVLRVYRHGFTAGIPPLNNSHLRGLRGDVKGWTKAATRSNNRFLWSVDERELDDGVGAALTLTVRVCPESAAEWTRMREAMVQRLRRMGLIRLHWLTEWQSRGVPHLHMAAWFERRPGYAYSVYDLVEAWLAIAGGHGAQFQGQHVTPVVDAVGWFKYLSKHAVRGLQHYQRSSENMPSSWSKTGRMWGHGGDWPVVPELRIEFDNPAYYAFRRIVRGWRLAGARAAGDANRVRAARRMLRSKQEPLGRVRGPSEWCEESVTLTIVAHLAAMGYSVRS
jgi:hypothetical protein